MSRSFAWVLSGLLLMVGFFALVAMLPGYVVLLGAYAAQHRLGRRWLPEFRF